MNHRHIVLSAVAAACLAALGCFAWILVTGPLAPHVHSVAQEIYGILMIMAICVSIVTGVVVGAWDPQREEPRKQHHIIFRTPLHH